MRIATERGITYHYVMRLRKLSSLNPPAVPGRNIVNPERRSGDRARGRELREAVAAGLREGLTLATIGRRLGIDRSRVWQIKCLLQQRWEL